MIRGYITNLRRYNEGQLVGKWIDFPITEEELEEVFNEIGINEDYEEYFITDWETDWELDISKEFGEYPNIFEVSDITEELEAIEDYGNLDWLYAYIECSGVSLFDAVKEFEDNSIFYGHDAYEVVEQFLSEYFGIEDRAVTSILNYMNYDDFANYELNLYQSDYGYIECF